MQKTILTIDDDPAITELLSLLLQTHGYSVLTANSGESGVHVIKDKNPDIAILDLMMPGMDGWQVCRQVRKFSNLPILILSALDDPSMIASVLDSGADDYLVKPVSSNILVAHIKKLLRRTGSLESQTNSAYQPTPTQPVTSTT